MRRVMVGLLVLACAVTGSAAVFERYLSPERPLDRAILKYLELERSGAASSWDLANLAVLLLEKGFPVDAERYLRAALKADKHNFEAAYRLGLVLQRQRRDHEALKYYRGTIKQRPGHAYARFMLALAEERCGAREAAIRDYAKAYRFAPELADPNKNPLLLDSELQTETQLRRYQDQVLASTLKVTRIDPNAIRRMMEAVPQKPGAAPTPVGTPPTPGVPLPPPASTPTPAVAASPAAVPAPATPPVAPVPPTPGMSSPLTIRKAGVGLRPGAGNPPPQSSPTPGPNP